jgi:uncharacterized membrane protein
MEGAHFHLLVNHLPFIIPGIASLILIAGFFLKSDVIKRVAFSIYVIGAISTLPAFGSGEDAEEAIENLPGVSHKLIHNHEEAAESFAYLSYLLGAMAALSLWANYRKRSPAKITQYLVLAMAIIVLYYAKITGTSGGEIRHPEIRSEASAAITADTSQSKRAHAEGEEEDHD